MLQVQYRMHEAIMGYSSRMFYGNALQAHHSVAGHTLPVATPPLMFIDTAGCGFEEREDGTSISNPEEAVLLYRHLAATLAELHPHVPAGKHPTVAIIAPYRQQLQVLQEQLLHVPDLQPWLPHIAVNTIDSFQGQERDIVYISMTRSNSDSVIGFLSDIRRMNVAMTRARKKLVVIGDSATLSVHPFYDGFISWVQEQGGWLSAWEVGWE
jgi:superfamily I DNA and/or RNA helicase